MKRNYELTVTDIDNGINRFLMDVFSSAVPSNQPKLIIVSAGPGAGKTGLELHYKRKLKEQGEKGSVVNSDKIAMYHPNYEEALEELPYDCYTITRQFVRPATPVIFEKLRKNRINIINENTLDKGQKDMDLIRQFKEAGYRISINVMATDMFIARLACYEREAREIAEGQIPRGVSKETQNRMYNGFVEEIFALQDQGLCDEVNVYTRGESINHPQLVYQLGDTQYENFQEAMEAERKKQRQTLIENSWEYLKKIEETKAYIARNGVVEELTQNALIGLEELKQDFIQELSKEKMIFPEER